MHNNRLPYSVPEGYLDNLQSRLSDIPCTRAPRTWYRPYFALAAAVVAAVLLVGGLTFKGGTSDRCSDDEIIEYLIDSGTTLAYIECSIQDY